MKRFLCGIMAVSILFSSFYDAGVMIVQAVETSALIKETQEEASIQGIEVETKTEQATEETDRVTDAEVTEEGETDVVIDSEATDEGTTGETDAVTDSEATDEGTTGETDAVTDSEATDEGTTGETDAVTDSEATEEGTTGETDVVIDPEATEEETEVSDESAEELTESHETPTGSIEVDLYFPMPIADTKEFELSLQKKDSEPLTVDLSTLNGMMSNGVSYSVEMFNAKRETLSSGDIYFLRVIIRNLELGNYDVKLVGTGYLEANIADIELNDHSKRIKLASGVTEVTMEEHYPNLFLAGDVNQDGEVNQEDYQLMLMNIGTTDLSYDLNRDGVVDITDLTYVFTNQETKVEVASIELTNPILKLDQIKFEAPDILLAEGQKLTDLLSNENHIVALSKENHEAPSEASPLTIGIDFSSLNPTNEAMMMERIIISSPSDTEEGAAPESGYVSVEDENGNVTEVAFNQTLTRSNSNQVVINLGSQVAVKKVSINVTGNRGNKTISQIAKVEFLNNVYEELPKPQMNIPFIKTLETSTNLHDERITISWDNEPNVTSYEVTYEQLDEKTGAVKSTKKLQTNETSINILDKAIKPYSLYRVKIQSLNGDWSSGYVGSDVAPSAYDGIADNVDANYNPNEDYYNGNIGSVTEVSVIPNSAPAKPINLVTVPGFKSFTVSWENHLQARDFDIYYRRIGDENKKWVKANQNKIEVDETSQEVTSPSPDYLVRAHSYTINGLEDNATYEVRVTATNHLGTSKMSDSYLASTERVIPPVITEYRLINRPTTVGEIGTEHIIDVVNKNDSNGWGNDSHLSYDGQYALVDGDFTTSWVVRDWDTGAVYGSNRGSIITFDQEYQIGMIAFAQSLERGLSGSTNTVKVTYWTDTDEKMIVNAKSITAKSSNTHRYYIAEFEEPINAKKIKVDLAGYNNQTISELKFYEYDSLEKEVAALFTDSLRVKLSETATQEMIEELIGRANTPDLISGDYHPNQATILKELELAQSLLVDQHLSERIVTLDASIRDNGAAIGISNAWQSLGAVARPSTNELEQAKSIVVYMGSSDANTQVEITFLQAYGAPGQYLKGTTVIKPGRTEIVIPEIFTVDVEKGGAVMAKVRSGSTTATIQIRLSNVTDIPHLNVHHLINDETKEAEVKQVIETYITDLQSYVDELPSMYPSTVTETDKLNNVYLYDEQTSVLNSTDIEGDRFTLTVPATQILKSIQSGLVTKEQQIERVYQALKAWEQELLVTYAKKGVFESVQDFNGDGSIDQEDQDYYTLHKAPTTRLNTKYQRMIMGAAAYASSHHVGVGFGEVANFMQGVPYEFDEHNQVTNIETAKLYGELMGHEIGHVVDISNRLYPETSNNLLPSITETMLNQDNPKTSGAMNEIYQKVTSNTYGLSTNRSVVLGMLWQPHLAYEDNLTANMLLTNFDGDLSNDSYFAKLNRAYRAMSAEEKAEGDRDQWLIRLSSKVVEKDLTDFYLAYGIIPNTKTLEYVSQFEKEARPIQYLNDEARRRRLEGTGQMSADTMLTATFGVDQFGTQIANRSYLNQRAVPLEFSVSKDQDCILGYEIYRNGVAAGFVLRDKTNDITRYEDVISGGNNRVYHYEVIAYDYELNATERVEIGEVKVRHDGTLSSQTMTVTSNTIDLVEENNDIHADTANAGLANIIDQTLSTIYEGRKLTNGEYNSGIHGSALNPNQDPYIMLDLNAIKSVIGIKYTAPTSKGLLRTKIAENAIKRYKLEVSPDGQSWTTVSEGIFNLNPSRPTEMIYFGQEGVEAGTQLNTYQIRYVKLTAPKATQIAIAELELVGPPGDNIEIGLSQDQLTYENGVGILSQDFIYQADDESTPDFNEEQKIPAGSIVVTGEYRGNPAFNIPLVLNENDEHIADQYYGILLAELPEKGQLEEVSEGTWIYWVEPDYVDQFMKNQSIFAQLYRTDSADVSVGGQRLTSDTFSYRIPAQLPEISFGSAKSNSRSIVTKLETEQIQVLQEN